MSDTTQDKEHDQEKLTPEERRQRKKQGEHAPKIKGKPGDEERLREREWQSFPASDAPPHSPGSTKKQARDESE